jgi:hypothetical protein
MKRCFAGDSSFREADVTSVTKTREKESSLAQFVSIVVSELLS